MMVLPVRVFTKICIFSEEIEEKLTDFERVIETTGFFFTNFCDECEENGEEEVLYIGRGMR